MADTQISNPANVAVPSTYLVKDGVELQLKTVFAEVDGSGAAVTFLPAVVIRSDSGHVVSQAADQNVTVAGGGSASVSWFPRLRARKPKLGDCLLLGSGNGTSTLTIALTKAVPATGLLQVIQIGTTVGDRGDTASFPGSASDSKGVAGWVVNETHNEAQIGGVRQDIGPLTGTTAIITSSLRPCTAGDLVAGDTITVHWNTRSPALFHTSGLVVWMKAKNPAVKQDPGFAPEYGFGDSHPDIGPSLTSMSWYADYGVAFNHFFSACHMITGMGAYPARAGFTPINGTVVGEIASGTSSIAAVCLPAGIGVVPDPGGTWPAGAQMILGNYQGATLLP